MIDLIATFIKNFLLFCQNTVGIVYAPYATYRKIALGQSLIQSLFIFTLIAFYFMFSTSIRIGVKNPYILTLELNKLFSYTILTALLFSAIIYAVGILLKGKGNFQSILLSWSYTLIPTLMWFFITSVIFIFFPPPRTLSFPGLLLSVVFIAFSITMLFWKIVLYFLTLRFALKLNLWKILTTSFIIAPCIGVYGILMYKLGIFRIPFI